jgi:hypothetical protein
MQWRSSRFSVLVAIALSVPCPVNGKSFRSPKEDDSMVERLEADNEALMKQNKHLEEMMMAARAEVQRMDMARKQVQQAPQHDENVAVLNQEIGDLKSKLEGAEGDKKALVQTLRQMLQRNSSLAFKKQAEIAQKAQETKFALELKCGQDRAGLEDQLKQSAANCQKKIEEASGKCDDARELAQTLQEQNMDLQKKVHDLEAQLAKSVQTDKDLSTDKANLVATMHSLMRETATYKDALERQNSTQTKLEKELAAEEAKLAKLLPKPKTKPKMKQSRRDANYTFSHKHEDSEAYQLAHMKDINHYIIRSQEPSTDDVVSDDASSDAASEASQDVAPASSAETKGWRGVGKQMDDVQQQVDKMKAAAARIEARTDVVATATAVPSKAEEGLKEWLGINADAGKVPKDANGLSPVDALDPATVKQQEKKVELQKKQAAASKNQAESDDEGGDGIEDLLKQAKAQLKAMDDADSTGSAASTSTP